MSQVDDPRDREFLAFLSSLYRGEVKPGVYEFELGVEAHSITVVPSERWESDDPAACGFTDSDELVLADSAEGWAGLIDG